MSNDKAVPAGGNIQYAGKTSCIRCDWHTDNRVWEEASAELAKHLEDKHPNWRSEDLPRGMLSNALQGFPTAEERVKAVHPLAFAGKSTAGTTFWIHPHPARTTEILGAAYEELEAWEDAASRLPQLSAAETSDGGDCKLGAELKAEGDEDGILFWGWAEDSTIHTVPSPVAPAPEERQPHKCPVCYFVMQHPANAYNICERCGTEFENDDDGVSHEELRKRWILAGRKQFFRTAAERVERERFEAWWSVAEVANVWKTYTFKDIAAMAWRARGASIPSASPISVGLPELNEPKINVAGYKSIWGRDWGKSQERARQREEQLLASLQREQALAQRVEELERKLREVEDQRDKAIERRDSTHAWYAVRNERLHDWARKEIPDELSKQYFSIAANGTRNVAEPPTYGQILNTVKYRAEKAEQEKAKLVALLQRALDERIDDEWLAKVRAALKPSQTPQKEGAR